MGCEHDSLCSLRSLTFKDWGWGMEPMRWGKARFAAGIEGKGDGGSESREMKTYLTFFIIEH